jgi:hypothetical protein
MRLPAVRSPRVLAVLLFSTSACAAPASTHERVIEIVADDYSFVAPDTVSPGPAVLRLKNHGSVPHEMIVMRLRPGASVADLFAAQQRGEPFRPSLDGGNAVLFAQPGAIGDGRLRVDLEPGRDYVLWCDFRDGEKMPAHSAMGMFKQIHVGGSAGAASASSSARRVVVDADDYAFGVADTLPAGETDFAMTNSGVQRHEVAFGRLKAGTALAFFFSEYLNGNDVDSLYDDDGAILTAYGGDRNDFAVRIDLIEGRSYVLLCEFSDTPDGPVHAEMGMFKGIEVR